MADKRIYELTDTQASHSTGIFVQVDNSGFSNTKKMDIATIYPKTNTLDAAGDFNPASTLVRLDNGSGSESKATVNAFLTDSDVTATLKSSLGVETSVLTFTGVPDSNYTITSINGKKYGNVRLVTCEVVATASSTFKFLKTIVDYDSPGFTVYFVAAHDDVEEDDGGWGFIETNGNISIALGQAGTWRFQATIIS